jgi:hypothetical protein
MNAEGYRVSIRGAVLLLMSVSAGPESLFADTKTGRDIDFDGAYYELGTQSAATVPGRITHLRVYAVAGESGDHMARLWRNSDEAVVGRVSLRWEGDGPRFQVEKANAVSGPFQSVGEVVTERALTDPAVVPNAGQVFYRIRQVP